MERNDRGPESEDWPAAATLQRRHPARVPSDLAAEVIAEWPTACTPLRPRASAPWPRPSAFAGAGGHDAERPRRDRSRPGPQGVDGLGGDWPAVERTPIAAARLPPPARVENTGSRFTDAEMGRALGLRLLDTCKIHRSKMQMAGKWTHGRTAPSPAAAPQRCRCRRQRERQLISTNASVREAMPAAERYRRARNSRRRSSAA